MKPRFFQELHVCNLPRGRVSLDRDLTYFSPYLHRLTGDGYVHIPAGFVCDLTSLRFLGLVSRGAWDRAAAVHDQLYKTGMHNGLRLTKADCDAVFVEAMKCLHTHKVRVAIYREGVRWLAWPAWLGHRRRDRRARKAKLSTTNLP